MSTWDIPGSADEFFANGPEHYEIRDPDYSGDNVYAMQIFIEHVGLKEFIVVDYGTLVVVERDGRGLSISSGGLGDFHLHGYDVEEAQQ